MNGKSFQFNLISIFYVYYHMAHSIQNLLFILIAILVLGSCKKKYPDSIYFGQNEGMDIQDYNVVLNANNLKPHASYKIDVDKDGEDDLECTTELIGPSNNPWYEKVRIDCLHDDILFEGSSNSDSTFHGQDTLYLDTMGQVWVTYLERYSCDRVNISDNGDPVLGNFQVNSYSIGQLINSSAEYQSERVYLYQEDEYWLRDELQLGPDTSYYSQIMRRYDCGWFPKNQNLYIGFKINKGRREKIGWVKVKVTGVQTLHLIQTGIQI